MIKWHPLESCFFILRVGVIVGPSRCQSSILLEMHAHLLNLKIAKVTLGPPNAFLPAGVTAIKYLSCLTSS
jgi:hypothetical protein